MTDRQYQDFVLEAVREEGDGYVLTFDGGLSLGCPKVDGLPAPQVGETIRTYGRGFGYTVRGIVIGGRTYRYLTEEQEEARHEAWVREQQQKREHELTASRVETDRRIAALPQLFRERIEKFQRDGGHDFRRDYEGYELFCCEQAVVIAEDLRTEDAISAFHAAPWEEQKKLVPGLDDGHSGNTFGMACQLARVYVKQPELVTRLHGALTPLVGCEAYGCAHPQSLADHAAGTTEPGQ